jgi:DnaK suppressor protein
MAKSAPKTLAKPKVASKVVRSVVKSISVKKAKAPAPAKARLAPAKSIPAKAAKLSPKASAAKVAPKPIAKVFVKAAKPAVNSAKAPKAALLQQKQSPAPVAKAVAAAVAKVAPKKKSPKISEIVLPPGYMPSESEPFMNEMHRAYFRAKLLNWKEEIIKQNRETLDALHDDTAQHADLADRATSETDRALELRARDRQRKLIAKIDSALSRIDDGSYGFCEETGEPIGLRRLDARPIATMSLEAQERHERRERVFREE